MHDTAEILSQPRLLGLDRNDAMEKDVMRRPLRDGREGMRVNAQLAPQPLDAVEPMQMTPSVVEAEAAAAG